MLECNGGGSGEVCRRIFARVESSEYAVLLDCQRVRRRVVEVDDRVQLGIEFLLRTTGRAGNRPIGLIRRLDPQHDAPNPGTLSGQIRRAPCLRRD